MRITRRRMDFLQKIKQLHEATNLPVHYARVAELLGVSKWSAYEMLKILEKEGLLASQYEVNQGEKFPGRAMVLFAPTRLADLVLSGKCSGRMTSLKEWRQVRQRLLSLCEEPRKTDPGALVELLMAELPGLERPLIFGAYVIALSIAQLRTLSEKSINLVRNMIKGAARAETGLAMFAGTVMGTMLKTATQSLLLSRMAEHLAKFEGDLTKLNESEQLLLMDFLQEALEKTA